MSDGIEKIGEAMWKSHQWWRWACRFYLAWWIFIGSTIGAFALIATGVADNPTMKTWMYASAAIMLICRTAAGVSNKIAEWVWPKDIHKKL